MEAQDIDFELAVDAKSHGPSCLDVESSDNLPESDEGHGVMDNGSFRNGDRKCCVDNHATDHNYACSGFPMRKAGSNVNGPKYTNSPKEVLASDLEHKSENSTSDGAEMNQSRKRRLSACNKESTDKERILPKRYRGPYCEDSSKGNDSPDGGHYNRSRSRLHSSSDEQSDHERSQHNRKYYSCSGSSDTDKNQYKRSYRRHSLCSNDSFDERDYSSSDEDGRHDWRQRYDPRESESDFGHKHSSSERDSDSYRSRHRRRQRSRSKDRTAKTNDGKENKGYHDIELERKMGFKFDHNIKGTAKVLFENIEFFACFFFS